MEKQFNNRMKDNFIPKSYFIKQKIATTSLILLIFLSFLINGLFYIYINSQNELDNLIKTREKLEIFIADNHSENYYQNLINEINEDINNLERRKHISIPNFYNLFNNLNKFSQKEFKVKKLELTNQTLNFDIKLKNYRDLNRLTEIIEKSNFNLKYQHINYDKENIVNINLKGEDFNVFQ